MDDKTIKVSVLEGDLAMLSTLGFPLPLCIQLQLSCLRIDEAMWTARSSPGGFLSTSSGLPLPLKRMMFSIRKEGREGGGELRLEVK